MICFSGLKSADIENVFRYSFNFMQDRCPYSVSAQYCGKYLVTANNAAVNIETVNTYLPPEFGINGVLYNRFGYLVFNTGGSIAASV